MPKKLSPLGGLMDQLDISIQELADFLQIDKTTISKWRTGSRPLLPRSPYLDAIISLLLEKNEKNQCHPIQTLWTQAHPEESFSPSRLCDYLKQYLTSYSSWTAERSRFDAGAALSCASIPEYTCLIGADGRKKAIEALLTAAEEMEVPGEIKLLELEQLDWLNRDLSFLKTMMSRLKLLVVRGFHLEVAFSTTGDTPPFRAFIMLLNEFRYRKAVKMHVVNAMRIRGLIPHIYVVKDKCAAVGLDSAESAIPIHTNLFADFLNVHKCGLYFDSVVELFGFSPVVTDVQSQICNALRTISCMGVSKRDLYYFSDYLSIVTMSENLLSEILNLNAITGNARECCLYYYRTIRNCVLDMPREYFSIFYWNIQAVEAAVTQEVQIEHELSTLINRTVYKTRAHYRRHLQETISFLTDHPHAKAVMRSGDARMSTYSWLKKELWCLSLNTHYSCGEYQVGFLHDPYLIKLTEEIFEQAIQANPVEHNSMEHCLAMLDSLVAEMPEGE